MIDRSAVMKSAWRIYRSRRPKGRFMMICWREALQNAWGMYRLERDAARPRPVRPTPILSPMEAAIDATKYLPSRMSQARAIDEMRAHFAAAGAAA